MCTAQTCGRNLAGSGRRAAGRSCGFSETRGKTKPDTCSHLPCAGSSGDSPSLSGGPCGLLAPTTPLAAVLALFLMELCWRGRCASGATERIVSHRWRGDRPRGTPQASDAHGAASCRSFVPPLSLPAPCLLLFPVPSSPLSPFPLLPRLSLVPISFIPYAFTEHLLCAQRPVSTGDALSE